MSSTEALYFGGITLTCKESVIESASNILSTSPIFSSENVIINGIEITLEEYDVTPPERIGLVNFRLSQKTTLSAVKEDIDLTSVNKLGSPTDLWGLTWNENSFATASDISLILEYPASANGGDVNPSLDITYAVVAFMTIHYTAVSGDFASTFSKFRAPLART